MLEFRQTMDDHAREIYRNEEPKPIGHICWHPNHPKGVTLFGNIMVILTLSEMKQIVAAIEQFSSPKRA